MRRHKLQGGMGNYKEDDVSGTASNIWEVKIGNVNMRTHLSIGQGQPLAFFAGMRVTRTRNANTHGN
ncbi:hypothetical protein ACA910_005973 [Epithemia clementina (nom. ined.)]